MQRADFSDILPEDEANPFSMRELLLTARHHWFWVFFTAALGGSLAYYYAGSQTQEYQKTASVMLRDSKSLKSDTSARIMSELGLKDGAANLANESYILRSTELALQTVEKLNLETSYWEKKSLRLVDLYRESPILIEWLGDENKSFDIQVQLLTPDECRIFYGNSSHPEVVNGNIGELIELPFGSLRCNLSDKYDKSFLSKLLTVRHRSTRQAAMDILSNLKINRPDEKDASILELTLNGSSPQKNADILNTLIDIYNRNSREEKSEASRKTEEFIRQRLKEIGTQLSEVDQEIFLIKSSGQMVQGAESAINSVVESGRSLAKQIFDLNTQLKLSKRVKENLDKARKSGGLIPQDNGPQDAGISGMIEQYNNAYLEYQRLQESAGLQNPLVKNQQLRMQACCNALDQTLQNYEDSILVKIKELQSREEDTLKQVSQTARESQNLTPLEREHRVKEELYLLLLSKEQENALALAVAEPSAKVLEEAHGSDAAVKPETELFVTTGALGGAAISILSLIAASILNNKVRNKKDLQALTTCSILGELPRLNHKDVKELHQHHSILFAEHSSMQEGLHIIRNNAEVLIPRKAGSRALVYLITSTIPREGKSTIAANLAPTFSRAGRKTIIIDGDIRKASISRRLGGEGRRGLSDYLLSHDAAPDAYIHSVTNCPSPFDILYAGSAVPSPVALLALPRLGELIKQLRAHYDIILIDAPTYSSVADAQLLAEHVDIVLYLIRSEKISKPYIKQLNKLCKEGKLPNLAYILNAVNLKASSYVGYHYGYGQGYGYPNSRMDKDSR